MNLNETSDAQNNTRLNKKTVLKYSDKNSSPYESLPELTQTVYANNTTSNDLILNDSNYDNDYILSNKLNEVVLSNSVELQYYTFHNDKENVLKYINKHRTKLAHSTSNSNNSKNKKSKIKIELGDYLSIRDVHGNTPLHLATMMGHIEIAKLLLENGAVAKCRNKNMWTPLNEAISYGDREMIKTVLKKFENEVESIVKGSKPNILSALKEMEDFYVEITWNFESWIPIVSRFLPSDVCKVYKQGAKIRLECTLGDIAVKKSAAQTTSSNGDNVNSSGATTPFNWQRGDFTFIFDIEKMGDKKNSVVFMDNKRKTFVCIDKNALHEEIEKAKETDDYEKEVDMLMSREMLFLKLQTKSAQFVATQTGWFMKRDKIEPVNGYTCQFYDVNGMYIVSKMRCEHLSDEDMKKKAEQQKKVQEHLTRSKTTSAVASSSSHKDTNGFSKINSADDLKQLEKTLGADNNDDESGNSIFEDALEYRPSLEPPAKTQATWNDYINADEGNHPVLGRPVKCKESKKEFKAQLAMSQEFPLTVKDLNQLLDALAPLAKFRKLKEFINLKLPPGFPVKIDIPIVPTVTAKVSFKNFSKNKIFSENLFKIPSDYTEEESILDKMINSKEGKTPAAQSTH